jgi:hypothetical protein
MSSLKYLDAATNVTIFFAKFVLHESAFMLMAWPLLSTPHLGGMGPCDVYTTFRTCFLLPHF